MAKKDKPVFNYNLEIKQLKEYGPERLYLLYGQEDYLRERFVDELKKICAADDSGFNYKRLDGPSINISEFSEAVDSVPFFSERSFVEIRGFDINRCKDSECDKFKAIISDIPEYCTVAVIVNSDYEMDGRLAAVKALKKYAKAIEFTEQGQDALIKWIGNRFSALGKSISRSDAEYLSFVSGTLMNRLIPEIEKISAYVNGNIISRVDIDAAAHRIPEADIFEMVDQLSRGNMDAAAKLLSDLMSDKDNSPIYLLAIFSQQFRKIYSYKLGQNRGLSRVALMELCGVRYDFHFNKLSIQAKNYSLSSAAKLVELCTEFDYLMKSGGDNEELMKDLLLRVAVADK
ncbi:MAG: DNA polymerase III subunit delta [Ruminococcaceae bacterium]|nr:DNA polymerase III subunit delta [Oscillospiraceae bacterium]